MIPPLRKPVPRILRILKEEDSAVTEAGALAGEPERAPAGEWEEASAGTGDANVVTEQPCTQQD